MKTGLPVAVLALVPMGPVPVGVPSPPVAVLEQAVSLAFEPNLGQADERVRFVARGVEYIVALTGTGVEAGRPSQAVPAIAMTFSGGNPDPTATVPAPLESSSHYFIGGDPSRWQRHVPHYARVRYHDVYDGIDAVYYGTDGRLEYDLVVEPGVDPGVIALDFDGVDALRIDGSGDLLLGSGPDAPVQHRPVAYQLVDGIRRHIDAAYALLDADTVGFDLGAFDASLPLVIDPVMSYGSYLGGAAIDRDGVVTVDAAGRTWVVGSTDSRNFAAQATVPGDAYACRFKQPGATPTCLFIGGSDYDFLQAIAVDGDGALHLAGFTSSADFPTANAYQSTLAGSRDIFVARIAPDLASIGFSTFLGGSGEDVPHAIGVDASGGPVITGTSDSVDFPVFGAMANPTHAGSLDVVVARLSADGAAGFATSLGGSAHDDTGGLSIAGNGDLFVAGSTLSADFPVMAPLQAVHAGGSDGYFARLDGQSGALLQASYLGGESNDRVTAIDLSPDDSIVLAGATGPGGFHGAQPLQGQSATKAAAQGFVLKLEPAGVAVLSNTLLGDTIPPVEDMQVDVAGNMYTVGNHDYWNLDPRFDPQPWAIARIVVAGVSADGRRLLRLHAFEGSGTETAHGLALDADGSLVVAGTTGSTDFPVIAALQPGLAGQQDVFLVRFSEPALDHWAGDFDGDGRDDILWRNGASGQDVIWPGADGATAHGLRWVRNLDWDIAGAGDFNGDGQSDVFWRNRATGGNALWLAADATTVQATAGVGNTNWKIHAVGDFDDDGTDDLAWHEVTTGQTALWFGAAADQRQNLVTITDLAWDILGAGDFDGDGAADLLWRHADSGGMVAWRRGDYGTPYPIRGVSDPAWQVVAIGDFDGNGRDDLAWRHMVDGRNVLWLEADPLQVRSNAPTGMAWQVAGAGDYDGDGTDDLLWRNRTTGVSVYWRSGRSRSIRSIDAISDQDWTIRS